MPASKRRHQLSALVVQVALHRVATAVAGSSPACGVVAEPLVELGLAAVGQVREPPRDLQAEVGASGPVP